METIGYTGDPWKVSINDMNNASITDSGSSVLEVPFSPGITNILFKNLSFFQDLELLISARFESKISALINYPRICHIPAYHQTSLFSQLHPLHLKSLLLHQVRLLLRKNLNHIKIKDQSRSSTPTMLQFNMRTSRSQKSAFRFMTQMAST